MTSLVITGDCRAVLATLDTGSVQCCVSSPPYYGLRNYDVDGQIGLEASPDAYVAEMVAVFRAIRRVLRDDGTVWLNIGDSYVSSATGGVGKSLFINGRENLAASASRPDKSMHGKPKDLLMIPARVALALQADGWWLRSAITWCKPAPMPESVVDRPTSATEMVFLLTKSSRYFYDAGAVAEPAVEAEHTARYAGRYQGDNPDRMDSGRSHLGGGAATRNLRNWWVINPQPYSGAHFATMPPDLAERCIKAGTRPGDTVLDPFAGAGTTLLVADRLGRNGVGIELNPAYAVMARNRVRADCPLFADVAD